MEDIKISVNALLSLIDEAETKGANVWIDGFGGVIKKYNPYKNSDDYRKKTPFPKKDKDIVSYYHKMIMLLNKDREEWKKNIGGHDEN